MEASAAASGGVEGSSVASAGVKRRRRGGRSRTASRSLGVDCDVRELCGGGISFFDICKNKIKMKKKKKRESEKRESEKGGEFNFWPHFLRGQKLKTYAHTPYVGRN